MHNRFLPNCWSGFSDCYQNNKMTEIIKYMPRCASPQDYTAWLKSQPHAGKAGFCEDCTPVFKMKMMDRGLCDHPDTRFERDDDGKLNGIVKQDNSLSLDLFSN